MSSGSPLLSQLMQGRVGYLLLLVAFVQSVYPITGTLAGQVIYQILYASMIAAGVLVARDRPKSARWLVIAGQ